MVEFHRDNLFRNVLLFGLGILVCVIIYTVLVYGATGIMILVKNIMIYGVIVAVLVGIVYLALWLFSAKKIDLVHIHKQRIVQACRLNETPYKQNLFFRSQNDDWATRYVGEIIGLCEIRSAPKRIASIGTDGRRKLTIAQEHYERMIFMAFQPPGLFNKIFGGLLGKVEVVGGVPADFSPLSASNVYLNGMTFAPPLYEIFFLAHHWEQRAFIDETIKENIYRYTLQENLKELATMMDDAIDASPAHKKRQETTNIQQLPLPGYAPVQQGPQR